MRNHFNIEALLYSSFVTEPYSDSHVHENTDQKTSIGNTIEWYLIPNVTKDTDLWVDIHYDKPQFPSIHFRNPQYLQEYRYKELLYVYDRCNDSQRTISRILKKELLPSDTPIYISVIQEDTLPTHRFPCSEQVQDNGNTVRKSVKINNRLFFIEEEYGSQQDANIKHYCYYIRYNHAPNVDIEKMQSDLNQFLLRYKFI